MKKIAIASLLLASFVSAKVVTIIDNGVERKISIPSAPKGAQARFITPSQKTKEIIVVFKKDAQVDINEFTAKYNLTLKKRLSIGYTIFVNKSNLSDIELINKVYKEEKNIIKTIRPNWGFNNKAI